MKTLGKLLFLAAVFAMLFVAAKFAQNDCRKVGHSMLYCLKH